MIKDKVTNKRVRILFADPFARTLSSYVLARTIFAMVCGDHIESAKFDATVLLSTGS